MNWLIHHGVWRQDIHWLGDLVGLAVAAVVIFSCKPRNRKLMASIFFMIGGYSSIPNVLHDNDTITVCYHAFWLLLAIMWTPIFLREFPIAAYRWWHETRKGWREGWARNKAAKARLREAQAQRRAAEARLALAKEQLQEAIKFGEEIEQAKRDRAAGKPFTLNGRVYGHEEIR